MRLTVVEQEVVFHGLKALQEKALREDLDGVILDDAQRARRDSDLEVAKGLIDEMKGGVRIDTSDPAGLDPHDVGSLVDKIVRYERALSTERETASRNADWRKLRDLVDRSQETERLRVKLTKLRADMDE